MQNFLGKDSFNWWLGVVEGRDDPLNLGRVQVRLFGWHTDNMNEIPSEDLPWAQPAWSPNSTMTSGAPLIGDFVFGFFSDGASAQAPIILGVFPGIPQGGETSKGFSGGSHYPIGEPTTSRLYRNEKIDQTIIAEHNNNLDTGVSTAGGGSWSEPKSQYNAKPPYNRVTETESGHVFELDDTPSAERIQLAHKAGTFFEIAPDGTKVTKVAGDNYEIFIKDNNIHVKGQCNITVDGNAGVYVKGNATQKVDGSVDWTVGGDVNMQIAGKFIAKATEFDLTGPIEQIGNIHSTGNTTIDGAERVGLGITAGTKGVGGNIRTVGDIFVEGSITSTGDVNGGGISLDGHVHPDPQGGVTGPPQ